MAIDQRVDGVVILSGPADEDVGWVAEGETPPCAWFGFEHREEMFADSYVANWDALGLPASGDGTVNTDLDPLPDETCGGAWPPYAGARRMVSGYDPSETCVSIDPPHGSMANDICLNVVEAPDGDPFTLFRPYLYAFCGAGAADADPLTGECPGL